MSIPLALETVLQTLSEKCQLTSWNIRGKGKLTTLIVRFNEDTGAISDQHEPVSCVTRYRKKSPSELRRDAQRAKARQQQLAAEQASEQNAVTQNNLSPNDADLETSPIGLFVSTPSQCHSHPPDASYMSVELEDKERNGSVDNGDPEETSIETQKQSCDVTETVVVQEEDVQQCWDDQSDGVKFYLSTLGPEHVSTVTSSAARPVVKKIVRDQRYGKYSLYATTDGAVFEYDLNKCCVTDWFPLGLKGRKTKMTYGNVERWPEVDHLRYAQQIDNMNLHIRACCRVIQRLAPGLCGKFDPQTFDQETTFTEVQ